MRVYISGKIGEEVLSDATRQKFAVAEYMLRALGYIVFNPTRSGLGEYAEGLVKVYKKICGGLFRQRQWYDQILLLDLEEVAKSDAICLLPDWRQSPGAKAELAYAQAIGLKILELTQYHQLVEWN